MATDQACCWVFEEAGKPLVQSNVPLAGYTLKPGELLVRIDAATICGSDLHTMDGRRVDPAAPLILGHEGMGTVLAAGGASAADTDASSAAAAVGAISAAGSTAKTAGQRVTWSVAASCDCCALCTTYGLPQKCKSVYKYGHASFKSERAIARLGGCYSSHILLRAGTTVVPLPPSLPDAVAAPANCALATMVCAWKAALKALAPLKPQHVLFQGCGLLGLYGCALAHRYGCATVAATDIAESRLALARRFGARLTADSSSPDSNSYLLAAAGAGSNTPSASSGADASASALSFVGFDAVFEVCGQVSAVKAAISLVRPGGAIVLVGCVHPASDLAGITAEAIIRKCATLVGVHNYSGEDLKDSVEFLAEAHPEKAYPFNELTSQPQPLSQLQAAVTLAHTGRWPRVLVVPG